VTFSIRGVGRSALSVALGFCLAICLACTEPADRLRVGMTEQDVIGLLGRPDKDVRDRDNQDSYLSGDQKCATKTVRLLVYSRFVREDVFVGLDARGTVMCIHRGKVFITQ
jgi:hypothetical protein